MNKADKELEVMKWMQEQGYDRRATQEVSPIIVKYIEQSHQTAVMLSFCVGRITKLLTKKYTNGN